jgi:uncharacterized protein
MLSVRLVLDTNIVISAALKPKGLQRTVFTLAITKPAQLYVSAVILEEYSEILARPQLRIPKGVRLQTIQFIKNHGHIVTPSRQLNVCADPEDNIFLECADAARADYLVTGNTRHYPAFWKSTKIITARELLDLVAPHLLA